MLEVEDVNELGRSPHYHVMDNVEKSNQRTCCMDLMTLLHLSHPC